MPVTRRLQTLHFVAIVVLVRTAIATAAELPKVVVILVDGPQASALAAETMPNLWALAKSDHATLWREGRSVMPSLTNVNHASLLTGTYQTDRPRRQAGARRALRACTFGGAQPTEQLVM